MANEGSTKPTYSELEAENLRVRGLLQRAHGSVMGNLSRMRREFTGCKGVLATSAWRDSIAVQEKLLAEIEQVLEPTFPPSSSLVPSGAESADIGKLNAADKSPDEYEPPVQFPSEPFPLPGSAETGGEKA